MIKKCGHFKCNNFVKTAHPRYERIGMHIMEWKITQKAHWSAFVDRVKSLLVQYYMRKVPGLFI